MQTDTTGGPRLSKPPFSLVEGYIIIFAKDNHLKTLKEILLCYYILLLQYISYAVIRLLSSSQESNRFLAII